jgi:hypothetical protein
MLSFHALAHPLAREPVTSSPEHALALRLSRRLAPALRSHVLVVAIIVVLEPERLEVDRRRHLLGGRDVRAS